MITFKKCKCGSRNQEPSFSNSYVDIATKQIMPVRALFICKDCSRSNFVTGVNTIAWFVSLFLGETSMVATNWE